MDNQIFECLNKYIDENFEQLLISSSTNPEQLQKVKIRPVLLKGVIAYQATEYIGTKVFHANYDKEELLDRAEEWFGLLKQAELKNKIAQVNILISKKGKVTVKVKKIQAKPSAGMSVAEAMQDGRDISYEHNRKKKYILEEGTKVPFLEDLGVFTKEGKIVRSRYDKFRQINRFLEFIEDIIPALPKEKTLKIIDFGCGKSYLTFAMYYYLKELKRFDIEVTGLDLKDDVIVHCNELAMRYGYDKLTFLHGDIADYEGTDSVDMIVTLHACDTATDYALAKAVAWNASVILSVPCCQHEVNAQIKNEMLKPVLRYGIIKERMSALITDALRADMLELKGYKVQLLEFIDIEHTPKNILIRAVKSGTLPNQAVNKTRKKALDEIFEGLSVSPALRRLMDI